jgi:aspartyl-tRNA(Asn)/glutamyl-tRNA(Gln) amidotransferase subunit C
MSKINSQTVRKLAKLTRLRLDPSQDFLDKYESQLSSVLEYLNELQEVDTEGVSSTSIISKNTLDELREDLPPSDLEEYSRIRFNIINNFPKKQGNLLVLPVRIVD